MVLMDVERVGEEESQKTEGIGDCGYRT